MNTVVTKNPGNFDLPRSLYPSELEQARHRTDHLFNLLRPGALYERPVPERHRLIFYLGHLDAFDWNLIGGQLGLPSFKPAFDRLFAFGIDPAAGRLPEDQPYDWPDEKEIREYVATIRHKLGEVLPDTPDTLLQVAIEHRWMHTETLTYLLHNLPYDCKRTEPAETVEMADSAEPSWVSIPRGTAVLGKAEGSGFGWDNEHPEVRRDVPEFAIAKYKVTNWEYLKFVQAGGSAPNFWKRNGDLWMWRGMWADTPLPLEWPVYVTHQQAVEYAAWVGNRLPTEPEYQRAAYGAGEAQPDPSIDNFNFTRWDPVPVSHGTTNGFGVVQMIGNGWEWSGSPFEPFEGFHPSSFYPNYSEPFFDGEHFVLKGASPRTSARLVRPSFRNWFRAGYPYAYAAFRLVED